MKPVFFLKHSIVTYFFQHHNIMLLKNKITDVKIKEHIAIQK